MQNQVKYVSSADLITAKWDEPLDDAYCRMKNNKIRHLPVISDTGHILGVISDRDFQRALQNTDGERFFFKTDEVVRDYMTWPAEFTDETTELSAVCEIMIKEKMSSLLITKGSEVTGIVTHEDLLKILMNYFNEEKNKNVSKITSFLYRSPVGKIADLLSAAGI